MVKKLTPPAASTCFDGRTLEPPPDGDDDGDDNDSGGYGTYEDDKDGWHGGTYEDPYVKPDKDRRAASSPVHTTSRVAEWFLERDAMVGLTGRRGATTGTACMGEGADC